MNDVMNPGTGGSGERDGGVAGLGLRLARLRHDLRNPLGEILGFAEILRDEAVESGMADWVPELNRIHQLATRILGEVNHRLSAEGLDVPGGGVLALEAGLGGWAREILEVSEVLSVRSDGLEENRVGDDLLRIAAAARQLVEQGVPRVRELGRELAVGGAGLAEAMRGGVEGQARRGWGTMDDVSRGWAGGPARSGVGMSGTDGVAGTEGVAVAVAGTLLIVDDNEANRALLARRLRRQGHTVALAENGRQALNKVRARRYDLVLLDVVMPEMGGYEVLERMKADPELRRVPVIMISALDDLDVLARCIEAGAEDYLSKPFDPVLLQARVGSSLQKKRLHDQEQRTFRALQESQARLAAELGEAAAYVRSLLPEPMEGEVSADWRFVPSSRLGGDAFGYRWIDDDHFLVYLLDVCSHGIGAALLSISVMNLIRSGALGSVDLRDPGSVLSELNRLFAMERQNNLYFTAWYGVYHRPTRRLVYATGGHPPAVLMAWAGDQPGRAGLISLKAAGPPVGTFPDHAYRSAEVSVPEGGRLVVFSDGVFEIVRPDGTMATLGEFLRHLGPGMVTGGGDGAGVGDGVESRSEGALRYAVAQRGSAVFEDDLAILECRFG